MKTPRPPLAPLALGLGLTASLFAAYAVPEDPEPIKAISYDENEAAFRKAVVIPGILRHRLIFRFDSIAALTPPPDSRWVDDLPPPGGWRPGEFHTQHLVTVKRPAKYSVKGKTYDVFFRLCETKDPKSCRDLATFAGFDNKTPKQAEIDLDRELSESTIRNAQFVVAVFESGQVKPLFANSDNILKILEAGYFAQDGQAMTIDAYFDPKGSQPEWGEKSLRASFFFKLTPEEDLLAKVDFAHQSGLDGDLVVDRMSYLPKLSRLYTYSDGNGGDTTIKEHTLRVIHRLSTQDQCPVYRKLSEEKGISTPTKLDFLKVVLALHDIGKGEARAKGGLQHTYTMKYLRPALSELKWSEAEIVMAGDLIDNDILGDFLQKRIPAPEAKKKLEDLAAGNAMTPAEYFGLQLLYYMSDAGSYYVLIDPNASNVFDTTRPCWYPKSWSFYDLATSLGFPMDPPKKPRPLPPAPPAPKPSAPPPIVQPPQDGGAREVRDMTPPPNRGPGPLPAGPDASGYNSREAYEQLKAMKMGPPAGFPKPAPMPVPPSNTPGVKIPLGRRN